MIRSTLNISTETYNAGGSKPRIMHIVVHAGQILAYCDTAEEAEAFADRLRAVPAALQTRGFEVHS